MGDFSVSLLDRRRRQLLTFLSRENPNAFSPNFVWAFSPLPHFPTFFHPFFWKPPEWMKYNKEVSGLGYAPTSCMSYIYMHELLSFSLIPSVAWLWIAEIEVGKSRGQDRVRIREHSMKKIVWLYYNIPLKYHIHPAPALPHILRQSIIGRASFTLQFGNRMQDASYLYNRQSQVLLLLCYTIHNTQYTYILLKSRNLLAGRNILNLQWRLRPMFCKVWQSNI